MNGNPAAYLLAYFTSEAAENGEQLRFAVSNGTEPTSFIPIAGGEPALQSSLGEGGLR
ncbi:hypothetical protein ACQR35_14495 [Pseudarthrobacter sp. J1738]|uniref:hypothetical protein n=1 Tax=Pseudarthrobacter sp. J1738 TaxID=3420446 RepID=UPI003D2752E4